MAHDSDVDLDPFGCEVLVSSGQARVLRQSTIGTADTCLQRLEYDLDPSIPYGTGEGRANGTAYHAGLQWYYDRRQSQGFFIPLTRDLMAMHDFVEATYDDEIRKGGESFRWDTDRDTALAKVFKLVDTYLANEHYWPAEYEVVGVEITFMMPLEGRFPLNEQLEDSANVWVVKGTIDLVLRDPNGWLVVVDHKTAKRPWKKGKESHRSTNQPAWYVHWLRQLKAQQEVAFVFDVMTYGGVFERRPTMVEQCHIDGVLKKAELVTRLIEQGGPYPPNVSSFLCSVQWCDHWNRCPFGGSFDQAVPVTVTASALAGASNPLEEG